ncbi:MAG: tripartite tricarboxylate transporter permease [Hyphomicrobiales bacterium]|nr:tripartite tricarboxylate transporter permease [Hyphomicrobiales bacterium]
MDASLLDAAFTAFTIMIEPHRLAFLSAGVLVGLTLGVIPGLGGIVGMALLLPFTFDMDAYSAFAFLLGMGSVTTTSDTIPAVLFGVPGTVGSAATILDGHPMAKKGQAGRAFGAAYSASMVGGVFGALLLGISVPVLRPVILFLGSPELLAFAVFGLSMVAVLSGGTPMRGLAIAAFGLTMAMVGAGPQTSTLRWTFGSLYLWDGIPLVPLTLGLFALPELADMVIARRRIAGDTKIDSRSGQWQGVKDTFRNWWLVIRVAFIGAGLGSVPGIGASVIDWIAYGHAARTEKGAEKTFGTGDVRGVLASEGSNNAKEGGALVPTIAFGVPGSASMAILLGAFLIHGLIPGPAMLSTHLDVTYSMVWSVALANILGAGICFAFSNQFAKVALVRYSIITPIIVTLIVIGAFQGSRNWGDLWVLFFFGLLGWGMKRFRWPRPPLMIGFVLGGIVERYLFISVGRYGWEWLARPVVVVLLALALLGFLRPLLREIRAEGGLGALLTNLAPPRFDPQVVFYLAFLAFVGFLVVIATGWDFAANIAPLIMGTTALIMAGMSLLNYVFRRPAVSDPSKPKRMSLDVEVDDAGAAVALVARRATVFLVWILGLYLGIYLIGMLPALFLFIVLYMRVDGNERWSQVAAVAASITAFNFVLFDYLLRIPWPRAIIGDLLPDLRYAYGLF